MHAITIKSNWERKAPQSSEHRNDKNPNGTLHQVELLCECPTPSDFKNNKTTHQNTTLVKRRVRNLKENDRNSSAPTDEKSSRMPSDFDRKRQRNESGESSISTDSVSKYIPTPPDGGWGWVVVLASFINHVVVDGIAFTFGVFFIGFQEHFGSTKAQTALVGSLLAGWYLMSGPFASAMVNRFGCRAVCIAGALISTTGFALASFSTSIEMLMVFYGCIGGFGFGLIYLPSVISVSYYFERRRALATGIAVCGAGVGCFVFAPAGKEMMARLGWKGGLWVVAGVVLNCVVCGSLMRPLEPQRKKARAKNFFDRLIEKHFRRCRSRSQSEMSTVSKREAVVQAVQEAKLAREEKLRNEENDTHAPPGGNFIYTPNNQNGVLPSTLVNDSEDNCNDTDVSEKAKMLRKYSINTEQLGSKAKIFTGIDDRMQSLTQGGHKGLLSALPPHMRKAMLNGQAQKMNGSLPDVKIGGGENQETQPLANGFLDPEAAGKSQSHTDIQFLTARHRRRKSVDKEDYARPLYRRDIFYSGSILHIPQFRSQPDVNTYVTSITSIPGELDEEEEGRCWRNVPLPKAAKDILKQMLDVSLMKDPVFMIALLGEVFGFIGLFVPFVFVTERAISLGVSGNKAAFLLSVIGITNTVGRVLAGWLADFHTVNSLLLHNVMMLLAGVACILNMFATTYASMVAFCAFFGLCVATYITLTSIILCDIIGLERLTAAFGFLTMVRGIASVVGSPVAGYIFDLTQNYDWSFHVGGVMFLIAGGLYCLLHLPVFRRRREAAIAKAKGIPLPEEEDVFPNEGTVPVVVVTEDETLRKSSPDPESTANEAKSNNDVTEEPEVEVSRKISFA